MEERSVDRLSRYIINVALAAVAITACWYFRSVLVYLILAAVVSLIGKPVMRLLGKITIKGRTMPKWLGAILSIIIIFTVLFGIVFQVGPIIYSIAMTITENIQGTSISAGSLTIWVQSLNDWIIATFPNADSDFKIEEEVLGWMVNVFSLSSVSSIVGSVASFIKDFGIGIFSVCFISFFLIKDEMLLKKIIGALSPDKIEDKVINTIGDIESLLSRYFIGLIGEILAVACINFLGLFLVARLGFTAAIGIAFMTGILNIIPYVGPLIGVVTGASLGLALKLSTAAAAGGDINAIAILLILIACLFFTQLVDNFVLQPVIYSTSIKSNPLEIFIVLLLAGTLGGIVGMLVAIPAYTVIRVIAASFYPEVKFIKRLIQ